VESRGQRGFTLIELMVALLVSSLLVGMILAIFSRMSLAYRGQQQIAGVQQVLAAARAAIELDAKQAGLGVTDGFTTSFSAAPLPPVTVVDSSTAPDQVALFYADTSTQARITGIGSWPAWLDVDDGTGFAPGDLIVLSKPDTSVVNTSFPGEANVTKYTACVLQIAAPSSSVTATRLTLATTGPWAGTGNCAAALVAVNGMVYKFVAHAYRIDTTPGLTLGALEQSPTGGLLGGADVWNILAYGFSDIQTALRVYQNPGVGDPDGDGDGNRDWYSGGNQNGLTAAPLAFPAGLLQMSISLLAHTDRTVEGIATTQLPAFIEAVTPPTPPKPVDNNAVGNRPVVTLPSADPLYPSSRIYRYLTFQVDFRNLGVGR
jgi:prepilin-type N-terminal cleavage/methylation domain-containing protein